MFCFKKDNRANHPTLSLFAMIYFSYIYIFYYIHLFTDQINHLEGQEIRYLKLV